MVSDVFAEARAGAQDAAAGAEQLDERLQLLVRRRRHRRDDGGPGGDRLGETLGADGLGSRALDGRVLDDRGRGRARGDVGDGEVRRCQIGGFVRGVVDRQREQRGGQRVATDARRGANRRLGNRCRVRDQRLERLLGHLGGQRLVRPGLVGDPVGGVGLGLGLRLRFGFHFDDGRVRGRPWCSDDGGRFFGCGARMRLGQLGLPGRFVHLFFHGVLDRVWREGFGRQLLQEIRRPDFGR